MNRWLALHRWRLLSTTIGLVALRVAIALLLQFVDAADLPVAVRVPIVVVCSVAMCVAAVATVIAFVQYGRIYNARIPTE